MQWSHIGGRGHVALGYVWLIVFLASRLPVGQTAFTTYAEAKRALSGASEIPGFELPQPSPLRGAAEWDAWVARHDREIRGRIDRGDQDTIVNWLLLGTSFTKHPPALTDSARAKTAPSIRDLVTARIQDFVAALASPGADERRLFARAVLEERGFRLETAAERNAAAQYLVGEINRSGREWLGYVRQLDAAAQLPAQQAHAASSTVFRTRGLSTDTSLLPNFAVEQSLGQMKDRGLLSERGVRRVAVVGPGLEFSDKSLGYDFYAPQMVQPFALLDALVRLNLADLSAGVQLAALDINPRITDHLRRARKQAERGVPYTLNLPLDRRVRWSSEFKEYWKRAGDRIGSSVTTTVPAAIADHLDVRVVAVRPQVISRMVPETINVVTQRPSSSSFDLIIATNIFVYYDLLDQYLALANIEAMLRPGGFLLSNNPLPQLSTVQVRSVGSNAVQYSPDDWDSIIWYQRSPH